MPFARAGGNPPPSWTGGREGCDKFCTFLRGALYTRGNRSVATRWRKSSTTCLRLADHGVREITLIGQKRQRPINGEGPDGRILVARRLAAPDSPDIPGIVRLPLLPPAIPAMVDATLIEAHRDSFAALMPFVHLPVQSGSDRISRRHEPQAYPPMITRAARIDRFRAASPRYCIFHRILIVGFPGRDRGRFSGPPSHWSHKSDYGWRLFRSNIRRGPGTPAADMRETGVSFGNGRAIGAAFRN